MTQFRIYFQELVATEEHEFPLKSATTRSWVQLCFIFLERGFYFQLHSMEAIRKPRNKDSIILNITLVASCHCHSAFTLKTLKDYAIFTTNSFESLIQDKHEWCVMNLHILWITKIWRHLTTEVQAGGTVTGGNKGDISMARGVVCWSCGVSFAHKGAICAVVRGTDAIFQMCVCSGRCCLLAGSGCDDFRC